MSNPDVVSIIHCQLHRTDQSYVIQLHSVDSIRFRFWIFQTKQKWRESKKSKTKWNFNQNVENQWAKPNWAVVSLIEMVRLNLCSIRLRTLMKKLGRFFPDSREIDTGQALVAFTSIIFRPNRPAIPADSLEGTNIRMNTYGTNNLFAMVCSSI